MKIDYPIIFLRKIRVMTDLGQKAPSIILILLTLITLVLSMQTAHADDLAIKIAKKQSFDSKPFLQELQQAEKYLNSFITLSSRFSETSSEYAYVNRGKISIARPGKLKVEYLMPERLTFIIKDTQVMYYDKENDKVSYGDMPSTPLDILLYQDISLTDNIKITNIVSNKSMLAISMSPEIPVDNAENFSEFLSITLVFSKNPMTLARIRKTNINNHTTTFNLINTKINIELDENEFPFHNPRGKIGKTKN